MLLFTKHAHAQVSSYDLEKNKSFYLSIGTNSPSYSSSTIHIKQGSLGNDYDLQSVNADNQSKTSAGILGMNFRLGYFFNYNQDLGVELSYDPVNYHIVDGQSINVTGKMDNASVNKTLPFSSAAGYYYYLGGANLILINLVKRFGIYKSKDHNFYFDALAKAGIGPVMPSVTTSFDNKTSDVSSFHLGGWNAGFEAALRATIYRHAFVEVAWKYDLASYTSLNISNGTAAQNLTTSEFIFSIGYTLSVTKHNFRFEKVPKQKKVISIGPMSDGPMD